MTILIECVKITPFNFIIMLDKEAIIPGNKEATDDVVSEQRPQVKECLNKDEVVGGPLVVKVEDNETLVAFFSKEG